MHVNKLNLRNKNKRGVKIIKRIKIVEYKKIRKTDIIYVINFTY